MELEQEKLTNCKYDRPLYDKFIEAYEVNDYQVLTPNGWVDIEGIGKTIEFDEWVIETSNGRELICADKHIMYRCNNIDFDTKKCDLTEIYCENLSIGDIIMTIDGPDMVMKICKNGQKSHMYDLQISEGSNKQYYTNGILSHNSLWMQNIGVKTADTGKNVLYITLEMSEKKVLKRLGAMRLKIPINDYDRSSLDKDFIQKKINDLKTKSGIGSMFDKKLGKIKVKFYAAGTATLSNFYKLLDDYIAKQDIKFDLILVDYITLIAPMKGLNFESNLYQKGKHLAEGLRAIAAKYNCAVVTGIQIDKGAWGSTDITLDSVSESKAIPETCDSLFAIIRTEEMKRRNKYRLKLLKQRDGSFDRSMVIMDLNTNYLSLENDVFLDGI